MNTEVEDKETEDPAVQCGDNQANKIMLLGGLGEIVTSGESDFWEVELDPFKNYLFDAIGAIDGRDLAKEDTYEGDLTLGNANILAFWKWEESRHDWGRYLPNSWISQDSGYGENAGLGIYANTPGRYRIEVASGGDGVNPTEGQLFRYTFTLPTNTRKFLNRLRKGTQPRKARIANPEKAGVKPQRKTGERTAPATEYPTTGTNRPPRPKATPEDRREYERTRRQRPERRETLRKASQANRQKAKNLGLCRDCSNPAIPGQTRCEICAEKHRQADRTRATTRREKEKAEQNLNSRA